MWLDLSPGGWLSSISQREAESLKNLKRTDVTTVSEHKQEAEKAGQEGMIQTIMTGVPVYRQVSRKAAKEGRVRRFLWCWKQITLPANGRSEGEGAGARETVTRATPRITSFFIWMSPPQTVPPYREFQSPNDIPTLLTPHPCLILFSLARITL